MAKLTKSQIQTELGEKLGISKKEAANFLEVLAEFALDQVKTNGEFSLPGLGKLVKQHRKARMGRNPATGEEIHIKAKTVVKFRVAKAAKEAVL